MTRCSTGSRERGEAVAATASTVGAFLLIEDPGPWGPHILHSSRLPDAVRATLRGWERRAGVRTLLIRRPGRSAAGGRRIFVANTRHGWVQTWTVAGLEEVADLDLRTVGSPHGVGLDPHPDPVLLVCTHGRHDPCCAERGRPLAAAIAQDAPDLLWEASHVGGDRFAGNLVALPRGDYFGGLDPESGRAAVAAYLRGDLDLDHHRGRASQPWRVQAAEHTARVEHAASGIDEVVVTGVVPGAEDWRVDLTVRGRPVSARVSASRGRPEQLTCHAPGAFGPLRWAVELAPRG